jgi:hypothetical protein
VSNLSDLGGKYTQQARSLHIESDGWIRGHHVPGAIAGARTRARLFDVSPSKAHLRMYYESLLKLEREIEMYHHRMAQLRIKLTGIANETLLDLEATPDDKLQVGSEWRVIAPDEDEETWLERNRNLLYR